MSLGAADWLNTAWMLKCGVEGAAFARASRDVARAQAKLLQQIVRANRDTAFGTMHRFAEVTDPRNYQQRVPLSSYEDFSEPIRRIASGEANVLTHEPVRLLEPTSGTSGGEKLIPYTAGLRRQFQRGVSAWIADLFHKRPAARRGRAYWSISPALGPPRRSPGGIPIGFDADDAYLGWLEQWALRKLLVSPAAVAQLADIEAFRYATLRSLLAAEDLSLISIWSPTFLTALLAPLDGWRDRLCDDLRRGTLDPPVPLAAEVASRLRRWIRPDPARADCLARILGDPAPLGERLRQVWPRLALISCWADAGAARFLPELSETFPGVEIQPKGLLATEGFVSFPMVDRPGAVVAVRCHFFELEEVDQDPSSAAPCRLAHELDLRGRYRVILTTAGGLYRYRLRDEIEVVGFFNQCPLIRFLGKSDLVSDLVGEKLAEAHVRELLDRLASLRAIRPRFTMLVPVLDRPPRYRLYIQGPASAADSADAALDALRVELQRGLEENPYYRHAIGVGQLGEVEVAALDPSGEPAWLVYERHGLGEGQKCGEIKPMALDRRTGWPERFRPLLIESASGRR
jgi:hypothetical protein